MKKVKLNFKYCECGCHCHVAEYPILGETLCYTIYNDLKGGFFLYSGHGTYGTLLASRKSFGAAERVAIGITSKAESKLRRHD